MARGAGVAGVEDERAGLAVGAGGEVHGQVGRQVRGAGTDQVAGALQRADGMSCAAVGVVVAGG
ncbi:hypothetical protein ACYF6T_13485 [Streptomyces sp. 7R007]